MPDANVSPWISVGEAALVVAMSARLRTLPALDEPEAVKEHLSGAGFCQRDVDLLWKDAANAERQRRILWAQ